MNFQTLQQSSECYSEKLSDCKVWSFLLFRHYILVGNQAYCLHSHTYLVWWCGYCCRITHGSIKNLLIIWYKFQVTNATMIVFCLICKLTLTWVSVIALHSQKCTSWNESVDIATCYNKPISGCIRMAYNSFLIRSLSQVVNRLVASWLSKLVIHSAASCFNKS